MKTLLPISKILPVLIGSFLLMMVPDSGRAALIGRWNYETVDPRTDQVKEVLEMTLNPLETGGWEGGYEIWGEGQNYSQSFVLDEKMNTLRFELEQENSDTLYKGRRRGDEILVYGMLGGKHIERSVKIGQQPFYFNPKASLSRFVLSPEQEIVFWSLDISSLKAYRIKAQKAGTETVVIGNKEVEVIRVFWAPDNLARLFFNRVYWFRPSDGLYLGQMVKKTLIRQLVEK